MGFLAGFTQGLGNYAQDMSKKMLDLRTQGAQHMADLYAKLAPNYVTNPALMGELLKRSQAFSRFAANPFDRATAQEVQGYSDPGEPIRNFLNQKSIQDHIDTTGQAPGKDFPFIGKPPQVGAPGTAQGPISQAISQNQNAPAPAPQQPDFAGQFRSLSAPNTTQAIPAPPQTAAAQAPVPTSGGFGTFNPPTFESLHGPKPSARRDTGFGTQEPNPEEARYLEEKEKYDLSVDELRMRLGMLGTSGGLTPLQGEQIDRKSVV